MQKKLIVILILFLPILFDGLNNIYAQQVGMYSHYFYNPMLYNPALVGTQQSNNIMLLQRNQWSDFKGAPRLTIFTIDGSLLEKKAGIGFTLLSDRKGITNRTSGNLSYSYRANINDDLHLLFGLSLGVIYQSLDFSKTFVQNSSDPTLFTDIQRKATIDGSAGFAFVWKNMELSAAIPQLFQNKINYVDNSNVRGYYALARHYMISAKYKFFISEEKGISLCPQVFIRFVPNAPFQFDGLINFDWKDKFWVGATYKSNYAVSANIGFVVNKQLSVGYSYDFIIGSIGKYSGTSQELMINFRFSDTKKNNIKVDSTNNTKNSNDKNYEEIIANLQTEIEQSSQSIKELEDKIAQQTKPAAPEVNLTLTDLIVQQLLKKIEEMLDAGNVEPEQVQKLRDEISAFMDSEFSSDLTQRKLKKQYEQLNKSQNVTSVLVKGYVKLQKTTGQSDFSNVTITITDKEDNKLVGTYIPNSKTGRYIFILTPGRVYSITAELDGYETFTEDFSPAKSNESYELGHEIRLKEKSEEK